MVTEKKADRSPAWKVIVAKRKLGIYKDDV